MLALQILLFRYSSLLQAIEPQERLMVLAGSTKELLEAVVSEVAIHSLQGVVRACLVKPSNWKMYTETLD